MLLFSHSSVAVLSRNPALAHAFGEMVNEQIAKGEEKTGATNLLCERFAKVGGLQEVVCVPSYVRVGSTWALQCMEDHQFHHHPSGDKMVSLRIILFAVLGGCMLEVFPILGSGEVGPLERYTIRGDAYLEMEFDGEFVHRFRPHPGGKLFAYSIHAKEPLPTLDAIVTQTTPYQGILPTEFTEIDLDTGSVRRGRGTP